MAGSSSQYRQALNQIQQVLLEHWDPIGVGHEVAGRDEYDSFIPMIYRMLHAASDESTISEYLLKIETEQFGLMPNPDRNLHVARLLIKLNINK